MSVSEPRSHRSIDPSIGESRGTVDVSVTEGTDRRVELAERLAAVRSRIDAARAAAGRTDAVLLVVVTKTFPAGDVALLAELGVSDVGENRDQEARDKHAAVAGAGLRWHMIGRLQRNKTGSVARWADVVESVDRPELVTALDHAAQTAGRRLDVLVQVELDVPARPDRGGIAPDRALELADLVAGATALDLRGIMGVAPYPGDPSEAFTRLARVAERIRASHPAADRISAGMSGDLEEAIAHGATQVRIGGAVLGERSYVH